MMKKIIVAIAWSIALIVWTVLIAGVVVIVPPVIAFLGSLLLGLGLGLTIVWAAWAKQTAKTAWIIGLSVGGLVGVMDGVITTSYASDVRQTIEARLANEMKAFGGGLLMETLANTWLFDWQQYSRWNYLGHYTWKTSGIIEEYTDFDRYSPEEVAEILTTRIVGALEKANLLPYRRHRINWKGFEYDDAVFQLLFDQDGWLWPCVDPPRTDCGCFKLKRNDYSADAVKIGDGKWRVTIRKRIRTDIYSNSWVVAKLSFTCIEKGKQKVDISFPNGPTKAVEIPDFKIDWSSFKISFY